MGLRTISLGLFAFGFLAAPFMCRLFGLSFVRHAFPSMWLCVMIGLPLAGISFLMHRDKLTGLLIVIVAIVTSPVWLGSILSLLFR